MEQDQHAEGDVRVKAASARLSLRPTLDQGVIGNWPICVARKALRWRIAPNPDHRHDRPTPAVS
jgi:hypothetical protein